MRMVAAKTTSENNSQVVWHYNRICFCIILLATITEQNEASAMPPFHLAFPVNDIDRARAFYGGVLGCPEGRSSARWVDFNFFGHQIVAHLVDGYSAESSANKVSWLTHQV